jgi:hypothetical protein
MPVCETPEPAPKPSGEVAAMVGVGLAIPLTCAMAAAVQTSSAGIVATINGNLMLNLLQSNATDTLPRIR